MIEIAQDPAAPDANAIRAGNIGRVSQGELIGEVRKIDARVDGKLERSPESPVHFHEKPSSALASRLYSSIATPCQPSGRNSRIGRFREIRIDSECSRSKRSHRRMAAFREAGGAQTRSGAVRGQTVRTALRLGRRSAVGRARALRRDSRSHVEPHQLLGRGGVDCTDVGIQPLFVRIRERLGLMTTG